MANRVLIGGTGYDMVASRVLVGGTGYDIIKGRTLIGGTGYDVTFQDVDFVRLMGDAVISAMAGRNESTTARVYVNPPASNYPYYVFVFCDGQFSINKFTDADTFTILYQSSATEANICADPSLGWGYSTNGSAIDQTYGATVFALRFPHYTSSVDRILSSITLKVSAGRNASSTGQIRLQKSQVGNTDTILISTRLNNQSKLAVSSPVGTVVFSNDTSYPSLYRENGYNYYNVSADGASNAIVNGGSFIVATFQ